MYTESIPKPLFNSVMHSSYESCDQRKREQALPLTKVCLALLNSCPGPELILFHLRFPSAEERQESHVTLWAEKMFSSVPTNEPTQEISRPE